MEEQHAAAAAPPASRSSLEVMGSMDRLESNAGQQPSSQQQQQQQQQQAEQQASLEEKKGPSKHPSVAYWRLFAFADGLDYLLMFLGTVGACTHGAAVPVFFIFFGKLIDEFGANSGHGVSKYALYFVYLGLVILVAAWLEVACWTQTGERQSGRMRVEYLKAMLSQDVGFFDTDTTTGEIVTGISSDTVLVQEAIGAKAGNYQHYMARFFAGFAVGFSSVWQLTLVTLAVVPAIALAGGTYANTMIGLTSKNQKAYAAAGNIAEESISQVRTVYSYVQEDATVASYGKALEKTMKIGKKSGLAKGIGVGATYGLTIGAWALLLWYAGVLVRRGTTNGGEAFTTILNVVIAGLSLGNAAPNLAAFGKGQAAGYNILEMIKRKPLIDMQSTQGLVLDDVEGHIELRNVCFSYPSRPEQVIFENFNLDIPAGKTVAVVGSSGSGKSTIISLIERFYDPQSGQVLLDGYSIKGLQLKWLRSRIGLVNQEPALFATSIRENILFGKEDATDEEIEAAARASDAHTFIKQLPSGYDTQVGEKGVQLSGGQKQRIALARAMVKNPSILLLDEATSALDAGSESAVQEALDRLMIGRTTIIVAHRLSTIKGADTIAVVHNGKVAENGPHDELMAKSGVYAALVRLQASTREKVLAEEGGRHSTRHSRGSSLSQRTFSFRASVHSDADSMSNAEELHRLRDLPRPSYWRLFKLNTPEWPYALVGVIGAILAGAETPLFAYGITQALVTFYSPDQEHQKREVEKIAIIFLIASVLTVAIYFLEHYFFGVMGERLTMRVRKLMFTNLLRNEVAWFDSEENNSSLLASRLSSDATMVRAAVGDRLCTLTQNMALVVTGFAMAFVLQWKLTLVIVALFPLMISAHITEHLFLKGFGADLSVAYHRATMVAGEAVSNIRTVAAFCGEGRAVALFKRELAGPRSSSLLRGQAAGAGYGVSQCCLYSSYGLALWYASKLIRHGDTGFGPVIKSFVLLIFTAFGVAETLALAPDIARASTALASVVELMDRRSAMDPEEPDAKDQSSRLRGDVELSRVCFSYPTRPDATVLNNLSLRVRSGATVAIVGESGSGKSSILSLVCRFYDPNSGVVSIDGRDVRRFRLRSLRRQIALVQQEPALFATSIHHNILYGDPAASEAAVEAAAAAAGVATLAAALPRGLQTEVGERGVQLSGGQKQRVAIARAVLKNPAILLLDEATSALDAESERAVQAALDRLARGRTTMLVAHRLSTVATADLIAVLHDGALVEVGSHKDLLARRGGAYARLVNLQRGGGGGGGGE